MIRLAATFPWPCLERSHIAVRLLQSHCHAFVIVRADEASLGGSNVRVWDSDYGNRGTIATSLTNGTLDFGFVPQLMRADQILIDLVGIAKNKTVSQGHYEGICW